MGNFLCAVIPVFIKSRFRIIIDASKLVRTSKVLSKLERLPDFPNSKCNFDQYLELSVKSAEMSYKQLAQMANIGNIEISENIDERSVPKLSDAEKLYALFDKYGSDKGSLHKYHFLYSLLLSKIDMKHCNILEIGLGTNNIKVPSNMGRRGSPGASLRAWRDFSPTTNVVGVDIDSTILFEESRIQTFHLDQTSQTSWTQMISKLNGRKFDLIIDDGLHSPYANLQTLINGKYLMKESGFLVIEDIGERSLPIWNLALALLDNSWEWQLYRHPKAFVLVLQHKN